MALRNLPLQLGDYGPALMLRWYKSDNVSLVLKVILWPSELDTALSPESDIMSTTDRDKIPASVAQNKTANPPVKVPPQQGKHTGMNSIHEVVFVAVLCLAQFLSLAAMNQTVAPMLILAKYFDIHDYGNLSWFSAAYSMTVGTFILPAGKPTLQAPCQTCPTSRFTTGTPTDRQPHRKTRRHPRAQARLHGRLGLVQSLVPPLVIPNAIAIIGRTFPIGLKRNIAFACFGAAGPTGAAVGAILASLVAEKLSWHWCFWFLAMTCAVLVGVSWFVIPQPSESASRSPDASPERDGSKIEPETDPNPTFDHLGALTGVTGLILINFALNQAPLVGWSTPYVPVLLVLGILSLAAFVWVELCFASQPIVPLRGLQRHAAFVLVIVFTGWSSHGIWVYYLYIFLEHLRGHSALLTSFETSPVAVTGIFFAFLTVYLLRRGVSVSLIMLISCFFFFLGSLLVVLTPLHQTYRANTFVAVLLMPGAMNLSFPAATILLSETLPRDKQGMAASLVATVVNYSISCGLGLAGSVHKAALIKAGDKAGVERTRSSPMPKRSESNEVLVGVRLEGLRMAVWVGVGLGALGVVVAGGFWVVMWVQARKARKGRKKREVEEGDGVMELERNKLRKFSAGTTTTTTGTTRSEDEVVEGEKGLHHHEEMKSV
ncbi:major facilitator superfamily-domain-containing protein [Sordaria sp. MPI-SDFR-AT-0083]|nr:major facilitator superfamily-domain-containing protein [Sordaria sp. MPI-SDFR-AT-0083]